MSTPAAPPATEARPFAPPGLVLFAAVAAMSWGGPLTRLAGAPALAVAAWRLLFSTGIILVIVLLRRELGSLRLRRGDWGLAIAAGLLLAAHFWSWVASLELTTVASSTVLVNTQPIIVGILSLLFLGERPTGVQWTGIFIAVAGAVIIGWGDLARGRSPLLGDALAAAGAVFVACYYVIGRRLRPRMPLWTYTFAVYGIAAFALALAVLLSPGVPAVAYSGRTWLIFLVLAAGPMMVGHTGVNYALRFVPAYVANVSLLGEPIGATLIAWLLPSIHERPPAQTLVGGALILAGIALGMRRKAASPAAASPAESAMVLPE